MDSTTQEMTQITSCWVNLTNSNVKFQEILSLITLHGSLVTSREMFVMTRKS